MSNTIDVEIIAGCEGSSLYINDYRVSGPKPWGGGRVVKSFKTSKDDILKSLGLSDYEKIKELLKECKEFISERLDGLCDGEKDELLAKINEVLR